mgnify:CR=1 FL=1
MARRWLLNGLLLPLYLSLTACPAPPEDMTSAGSDAVPEIVAEPAVLPDDADPALWVIRDEDTTIYLFGTVHILKPGMTWFDEAVKDGFDASDELVVEMIKPDAATMAKIIGDLAIDKTGVSLRDKLAADDRVDFEAAMTSLGLPVAAFDPLEPWFASVNLSLIPLVRSGYDANQGVEDELLAHAKARKIKITGLETVEQQLGFFDNLPEEIQIRFLNFTVDTIDETADGMEQMVAEWANANIDALAGLMNAATPPGPNGSINGWRSQERCFSQWGPVILLAKAACRHCSPKKGSLQNGLNIDFSTTGFSFAGKHTK